jgi:hypothetical protein
MSTPPQQPSEQQPSEEEMRAAYEAEIKKLRIEDVLVQTLVSLVNLGGRKAGLAQGTEDEQDPDQLRLAIEGAVSLLPLIEDQLGPDGAQVRQAISQLQMAYAQLAGGAPGGAGGGPAGGAGAQSGPQQPPQPPQPEGPGGGRLWVPGQ